MQTVLSFLFNSCLPTREGHVWGKEIVKGNMSSFRQFPLILSSVLGWQGPDWDVSHGDLTLYISQVLVLKVLIICSPNLEDMMSNNLTFFFFLLMGGLTTSIILAFEVCTLEQKIEATVVNR